MDSLRYKILKLLTANPGKRDSIRELSKALGEHYSLMHGKLQKMNGKEIKLIRQGKSTIPTLVFSYGNSKAFEAMEAESFLALDNASKRALEEIEAGLSSLLVKSMALINHSKNKGMNYYEIMVLFDDEAPGFTAEGGKIEEGKKQAVERREKELAEYLKSAPERILGLERKHGFRINLLLLRQSEFERELYAQEDNLARECFLEKIVFHKAGLFWHEPFSLRGAPPEILFRDKISRGQILYALDKYGIGMHSEEKPEALNISIERLAGEIIKSDNARIIGIIPALLAKNDFNSWRLLFIAKRLNAINRTGYLLEIGSKLASEKTKKKFMESAELFSRFKVEGKTPLIAKRGGAANNGKAANKWGILTRNTLADYKKVMELYGAD